MIRSLSACLGCLHLQGPDGDGGGQVQVGVPGFRGAKGEAGFTGDYWDSHHLLLLFLYHKLIFCGNWNRCMHDLIGLIVMIALFSVLMNLKKSRHESRCG
jgi:hypothetical protein